VGAFTPFRTVWKALSGHLLKKLEIALLDLTCRRAVSGSGLWFWVLVLGIWVFWVGHEGFRVLGFGFCVEEPTTFLAV
jgi:hypothetical protein